MLVRPRAKELPPDVLAAWTSAAAPGRVLESPTRPDPSDTAALASLLAGAGRPVLYVGGGVPASGAGPALKALAERLHAPVVVSENGRGSIDARHDLAFDALALRTLREDADLVLAVGTRAMTTFGRALDTGGAALALVNADAADLGGPRTPVLAVEADARLALEALLPFVEPRTTWPDADLVAARRWVEDQLGDIAPQRGWLSAIRSALPEDGVLVGEFTQVGYAAGVCFPTHHQRGYVGPGYQGTLGYGFATASRPQTSTGP